MTVEELKAKRDALLNQIANANQRLQSGNKAIEKRDMQQLITALKTIDAEIAKATGSKPISIGYLYGCEGL